MFESEVFHVTLFVAYGKGHILHQDMQSLSPEAQVLVNCLQPSRLHDDGG